jgi:hypothetical protein
LLKNFPIGIIAFFVSLLTLGMSFPMLKAVEDANATELFFWVFLLVGLGMIVISRGRAASLDAWLGGVAGILIWTAIGEIGELDKLYTHPGILATLVILTLYFILRPGTRCDFHLAIQKLLKIERPVVGSHWHAPNIALGVFWTVWLGHTVEKIGYYTLGTHSWLVWVLLIGSLVATPFLLYKMWKTKDWATAWARALPSVVIIWVAIDIIRKWIS